MIDVAALADVSLSTVSRVVNGEGAVRADLAKRVREAVELLGYRRDLTASTLRRADRASASVGLVFEDVANPFFASIHRGFEEVARARGVLTFVGSSDEDPARERELVHGLCERRVDGLVIAPIEHNHSYLLRDLEAGMALVFIDRPPQAIDADSVLIDNAGAAATAVDHLISAGHRRIGFLGDREQIYTARQRVGGYRDALSSTACPTTTSSCGWGSTRAPERSRPPMTSSRLPGRRAPWLTGQNFITIGAVHALQALGRQHEIALVGIDDVTMADEPSPG